MLYLQPNLKKPIQPTMKRVISYIILMFIIASCGSNDSYEIDGTLYGGASFEGETIYMVSFGSSSLEGQDSAVIRNGRFHFEGKVNRPEVCELRMRPMMRLFIDRLVLIKEPGHIWVTLNKQSVAHGTALNDSLQHWREYKMGVDSVMFKVSKKLKRAEGEEREALEQEYDELRHNFMEFNRQVVLRNDNVFGDYIDRYVR